MTEPLVPLNNLSREYVTAFRTWCTKPISLEESKALLKTTVHDLRHSGFTNAVPRRGYPHIADAIVGRGDTTKSLQSLYLTLSDDDLIQAIDMMKFATCETEIRVKK